MVTKPGGKTETDPKNITTTNRPFILCFTHANTHTKPAIEQKNKTKPKRAARRRIE